MNQQLCACGMRQLLTLTPDALLSLRAHDQIKAISCQICVCRACQVMTDEVWNGMRQRHALQSDSDINGQPFAFVWILTPALTHTI